MSDHKENLSAEEHKLLSGIYIDKQRISTSHLHDYQQHDLEILRQGRAYLQEKYPDARFTYDMFTPASHETPYSTILFMDKSKSPVHFTLQITESEDKILFEDNYYSEYIREPYDTYVKTLLMDTGIVADVSTSFPYPMAGIDASVTVASLLAMEEQPGRNTDIYLIVEPNDTLTMQIRELMMQHKLYGFYTLHYQAGDAGNMLLGERKNIQIFRCFAPETLR